MHVPLALKAGICEDTIDAIRDGRRPSSMSPAEAAVHDFVAELQNTKGVAQATYDSVIAEVGDQGLIDLVGIVDDMTLPAGLRPLFESALSQTSSVRSTVKGKGRV